MFHAASCTPDGNRLVYFDEYGRLLARRFLDGELRFHGRETRWGPDHKVARTREWCHGFLHGEDITWNSKGQKALVVVWELGVPREKYAVCPASGRPFSHSPISPDEYHLCW